MSTAIGRAAEDAAATFLLAKGFQVLSQNWRTRWCEIDIVACKGQKILFVEVKYRANDTWGAGLDYITPRKLQQMHFAAEFWVATHKWTGEYCLSAIDLTDKPPMVVTWLEGL